MMDKKLVTAIKKAIQSTGYQPKELDNQGENHVDAK